MELIESMEIAIFGLVVAVIFASYFFARRFGQGALGAPFLYFTAGTFMIGLARLFLFLASAEVYTLEETTLHVWWHVMFYLGMTSFALGGMRMQKIAAQSPVAGFSAKDTYTLAAFLAVSFLIFFIATPLEPILAPVLVGSFVETFGLHHFLAVIFAVFAGFYIHKIKSHWGKLLTVSVYPFLAFIVLMGLQHAWEVVTESWHLIELSLSTIEQVEQFIVLPALVLLGFGFLRILLVLGKKRES